MRANALFGPAVSVWLALHGTAQATTYSYTTIAFPGSGQTTPTAINDSGQIVGTNFVTGFLFSNGFYSLLDLGLCPPPHLGAPPCSVSPTGINDSGQIVGLYGGPSPSAFLDTNGAVTTVPVPAGALQVFSAGINNLGQVVGTFEDSAGEAQTYVYSNGVMTIIDALAGASSSGINDAGDIVGSCFVYANGTLSPINPSGGGCGASGINDSGQVVGFYYNNIGFVDTNNVFTTISVPGALYTIPNGINDLGQIVGWYEPAPGAPTQGFLASPIPEPATMLLLSPGLGLLYALKRRTRAR